MKIRKFLKALLQLARTMTREEIDLKIIKQASQIEEKKA